MGFDYFKKNYRLIAADLRKQALDADQALNQDLDADLRAIQQLIFTGKVDAEALIYYIYEKSK